MKTLTKTIAAATFLCALAPMTFAATELSDEALDAILIALDDEYKAEALYAELIETFGENTAFSNIVGAETTHADALVELLEKYGQDVPENIYLTTALPADALPTTLEEAYATGVTGEIHNIALYQDELLPAVTEYPDVTRVFTNLLNASATKHLPTFAACASGNCSDRSAVSPEVAEIAGMTRDTVSTQGQGRQAQGARMSDRGEDSQSGGRQAGNGRNSGNGNQGQGNGNKGQGGGNGGQGKGARG